MDDITLTPRQWRLHDLLSDGKHDRYYSKKEICEMLPEHYTYNTNPHKHDKCIDIYNDSKALQDAWSLIGKVLIRNPQGDIKFAKDDAEAEEYAERLYQRAMTPLIEYSIIKRKIRRDGQGRLISGRGDVIDEKSLANQFWESFAPNEPIKEPESKTQQYDLWGNPIL